MSGQYRVQSVQLSDYLKNLENACESPNFGYTHQGLEEEMERQQTIEASSKWIRESVTSSNHDILNQISYITERVQTNKDCLHYLAGITSMEDIYSDVAAFNARRALRLIMENPDNKFWRKKLSGSVNRCWQNLGRYSELATIHLKNAADFHQFYYDARHLEVKLNDRHKKFLYNHGRFAEMNHEHYTNSSKELRDWLRSQFDHLNYMVNRSKQLIEQSKSLVPIYLRTNRIKAPVNAIMLCDYETPKMKLSAGERVILIDNMSGGINGKRKFILRTNTNPKEEEITESGESINLTSDAMDTCETDTDSGSRTEEIDDRSSDSNSYLRYTSPRISTMPYWNFGHGQSSSSDGSPSEQTTSTLTENVSPLGQSSSKLHWHVRSLDGKVEALVPSVCVWIPSPDMEAQEKAIKLYKVILDNWNYIIDEQLKICLEFFTVLLQRFLESDGLTTDDDEAFNRFLNNLVFSLTEPPTAEAENFNKEFLRLINETREHWNRTKTFATRMAGGIHLRRTEIAIFQSLLDWNKAHMRTIKQYEQENIIPVDLTQKLNDLQEQSFHMMETVTLVNDLAQKDKTKLDSLLNQLRIWNKQTKDKSQFNIYPLSSSSDDEWLSSSGSEYINSESTYESVDEIETSYIAQSKYTKPSQFSTSLRFPHKTFILPSIFTYDEEIASTCTTSEEIQSIGTSSSCTTDDEIEDYHKFHSKQDFYRGPDSNLDENKNYVTTFNKQILLTLEPPVDTKDKPMTYKSRKYIDTKDGGRYSVVYIEVAPTEETSIQDIPEHDRESSKTSKSTQVDDMSKKTKFTRRTWIEEQHVEEAKSLKKIEESSRTIQSKTSKLQSNDVSIQVRPKFQSVECSAAEHLIPNYKISKTVDQQKTETHRKEIQTQTDNIPTDFMYAVQQFAHVKEITEEQFNHLIQQEAAKLNSKQRENKSSQTYPMKDDEFTYRETDKERNITGITEEIKIKGDFGCQYRYTRNLVDKQINFVKQKKTQATIAKLDSITHEEKVASDKPDYADNNQTHTKETSEKSRNAIVDSQVKYFEQQEHLKQSKEQIYHKLNIYITSENQYTTETATHINKIEKATTTDDKTNIHDTKQTQKPIQENKTQATKTTSIVAAFSQHVKAHKPSRHVKAPLVTETVASESPKPQPVRPTPLVEATQFVKHTTVDKQIDTVPVASSEVGEQTNLYKSLLDSDGHLSLKRTDATLQAKPARLCMVDSQSELHAPVKVEKPVVSVPEPPKPSQTLEACVQTTTEGVCVVDSATGVSMKSPESVLDSVASFVKRPSVNAEVQVGRASTPVVSLTTHKLESRPAEPSLCTSCGHRYVKTEQTACQTVQPQIDVVPSYVKSDVVSCLIGAESGRYYSLPCFVSSSSSFLYDGDYVFAPVRSVSVQCDKVTSFSASVETDTKIIVDAWCQSPSANSSMVASDSDFVTRSHLSRLLCDSSGYHCYEQEGATQPAPEDDVPLDSGDLEWELVDDNLKVLHRSLISSAVQTEEQYIQRSESHKEYYGPASISQTVTYSTINRKNFAVQYIYEPLQENVGCQTQPLCLEEIQKPKVHNQNAETMTDDTEPQVAVLLQNIRSTDIRERLIERYYYSAPRSSTLLSDAEVQVNLLSTAYRGHTRDFYLKELSTDYCIENVKENEDIIVEESSGHNDSDQSLTATTTTLYSEYVKRLLQEGSVTEVWEKCQPTHSVYENYQSRREYGSVREQASMAIEEPVAAADVGIQIAFDSHSHTSPSDSEISRSESPLSGSSYTYEAYLIRSRLGQICEVQCQFCPTHIPTASQTEYYGFGIQNERHEKLNENIFESYHRKLIKDEIAEAWTQVEQDSYGDSQLGHVTEPIDIIEERFLEITEKKSKKVYSQIKITEEFAEEDDMIVCELGVQTDSCYDQQYFIEPRETHPAMITHVDIQKLVVTEGVQTPVIRLASIISSRDLEWADADLREVIKTGIKFLGSDGHISEDTSILKSKSQHTNIYSRFPFDSPEKVLVSTGTQVIPIESNLEERLHKEWTTESISFHKLSEPFQRESDDVVETVGMLTEEVRHMSKILVQLRQRTLQYELFESQYSTSSMHWNNIREVASPRTGLFAPVAMAIRRGWIRLGEVNEYVDPMTGVAIPLETAYQQGRIRLTSSSGSYDRNIITNTPVLLLIERVYFSWCKAYLTSVVDTATGEVLSPNAAIRNGILETTEDEIRLLDSSTNTWITIEEGAGRQIIQLEPSTPTTESMEDELDEPASCKVYQLTHVCPGGEPSPWLGPLEAVRLGLLNWENGDVAADWPARPILRSTDTTGNLSSEDFIPTRWCSFLTAKQAGWLRFTEESEPRRYITTSGMPNKEPGSLLLSTQVNLLAPSHQSLNYDERDDTEQKYHHDDYYIPRTRSEEVYPISDMTSSNLFYPINVMAGHSKSASCTRVDTQQSYRDCTIIPSRLQIQHESNERSWASETQIWEEYQETSSRTVSPNDDTRCNR